MKENYKAVIKRWRSIAWLFLWAVAIHYPQFSSAQIIVGTQTSAVGGPTSSPTPYNFLWESRRVQFVYTATELTAAGATAGPIKSLSWDVLNLIGGTLQNYQIRMANVPETNVAAHNTAALTTVRNAAALPPGNTGWYDIPFDVNFTWDGTSSILVDVCWGVNSSFQASGIIWMYNNVASQRRTINSGSINQCGNNTTTAAALKPRIRFLFDLPDCAGTPTGGTGAASVASVCPSTTSNLSVTGASDATTDGFTFLWEASTDGGTTWNPATGTNNTATYTVSGMLTTTRFRRTLTCTASASSATSTEVEVTVILPTYASLPYTQDFNNWQTLCTNTDAPGPNWLQTPSTTDADASWRRQDQGATAGWTGSLGVVTPFEGVGAANFHTFNANDGTNASLDLYVNLIGTNAANPKKLTFRYQNTSGDDKLEVFLSIDGGVTFSPVIATFNDEAEWELESVTFTTGTANSVIRFKATSDFGDDDIGIDALSLVETFPCAGTPIGGAAEANPASFCGSGVSTLSVTGSSADAFEDLTFLWEVSTDGGTTWNPAAGTNNGATYITATLTATTQFRRQITCANGGASAVSAVVTVTNYAPTYTTLPYTQDFEVWQDGCDNNDIPSGTNWKNTPATGNTSWRRQDQGATADWSSSGGTITLVAANATGIARFHSWDASGGDGPGNLDLYVNLSNANPKKLSFFYRNSGGTDNLQVQLSEDGGATFPTTLLTLTTNVAWTTYFVDVSSVSATAVIRFRALGDFGGSDIGLDNINLFELPLCAGTPEGGTVSATITNFCLGSPVLSVAGSSDETNSGFTYLWEASTDGGTTWASASGVNNQKTYTVVGITANTRFRRQTICTSSALSAPSTEVEITVPYAAAYATLPYTQDFNAWVNGCATSDVPNTNWKQTPLSADPDASWRRQDQGSTVPWTFFGGTAETNALVTPFEGAGAANFRTYWASGGTQGALDLYVDLSGTAPDLLTFYHQNASGTDRLDVLQSTDGGATFTLLATFTTGAWAKRLVPLTSNSATTVIRFRATSDFGNDDIGIDGLSVEEIVPCAGTPVAGIAVTTPTTSCEAPTAVISVIEGELRDGLTYQWQSSADNATWANIGGATAETYTTPVGLPASTWYRRVTTCVFSSESAPSTSVRFEVATLPVYATLPFLEDFEPSWVNNCSTKDIPNASWKNTPATGNNAWRRQNEGATAGWALLGNFNVVPEINVIPISGTGAATFHSHGTFSGGGVGQKGTLDLYVNLSAAGTKVLTFLYSNQVVDLTAFGFPTLNNDVLNVLQSTDGGVTFTNLGTFATSVGWQNNELILTSNSATTIIRFEGIRDGGNSNIGVDDINIQVLPDCAGTPIAGVTVASPATITCPGASTTLSVTGSSSGTAVGFTYQWEASPDGVTWTPITGATGQGYSATPTATTQYRRVITCGVNSATSAPVTVTLNTFVYATLPYNEGFEAWGDKCADQDIPSVNWVNTPATGDNSWRRQDEGATAGWQFDFAGARATAIEGAGFANFHSYGADDIGSQGSLDLYVNASSANQKVLRFKYNNAPEYNGNAPFFGNTDQLNVLVSTDGGITFGAPILTLNATVGNEITGWTDQEVFIPSTSATTVIRLIATSDFGDTDIAVDALKVLDLPVCTGTPIGGNASALVVCNVPQTINVTGASDETSAGFTYQWEQSIDNGATWTNAIGTSTTATYSANPTVTTQYRRVITCTASAASATSSITTLSIVTPIPATLPYTQTFESSWTDGCAVNDLPDNAWKNTPVTGSNSWRRQNEGASAEWDFLADLTNFPQINATPISGTGAAVFHSWGADAGLQGTLDLYINASAAGAKKLRFSYLNADVTIFGFLLNDDILEVSESNDGGVTFTTLGTLGVQNTWKEFSYDLSVTSANAIIRFRATSDFGSSNLGIDNVNIFLPTPCAGTPNAGNTVASTTDVCIDASPELSVNGSSDATQLNFTYQWQQSIDGGVTWTDIAGATTPTVEVSPTVTTQYRRALTCTNSSQTATSVPVEILASPIAFATMPFEEGFEAWGDLCANQDIPLQGTNIYWKNSPATGNNSWRRQDEGASANWSFLFDPEPFFLRVVPISGTGAAAFHSYGAGFGSVGTLDLNINLVSPNQKILSFLYNNRDGGPFGNSDQLEIQESNDGGATFTTLATLGASTEWTLQTINLTSNSATSVIRFKATSDFGSSDIGVDDVKVIAPFPFDVGVTDISLDRCSNTFGKVQVTIENFGTNPASNFPVSFTYNGNTVTETFTSTLAPLGGTAVYTFVTGSINVLALTTINLTAATALAGDGDTSNDSYTEAVAIGSPLSLPYSENFNGGFPAGWSVSSEGGNGSVGWEIANPNPPGIGANPFPNDADNFTFDIDEGPAAANQGGTQFIATDDDERGDDDSGVTRNDYLVMPTFDLSNYTSVQLSFDVFFEDFFGDGMIVEASTDGGAAWTSLLTVVNAPWTNRVINLAAYNGAPSLTIRFHYTDNEAWGQGAAIDNVSLTGNLTATPTVTIATPVVPEAYVLRGTNEHIVYKMEAKATNAKAVLSDLVLKTAGTYVPADFVANSFRLWYSTDALLGPSDALVATSVVVPSGSSIVLSCINVSIAQDQTGYFFFTADVASAPTSVVGHTINVLAPDVTNDVFVQFGNKAGTTVAGGSQIIADPNNAPTSADREIDILQDESYTFSAADFAFADVNAGDVLKQIQILSFSIPVGASLTLNDVPVTSNQIILANQLASLKFTPAAGAIDAKYATFTFRVSDGRDVSDPANLVTINVIQKEIFVPTLFSPTSSTTANQTFKILGPAGRISSLTLKIFDRNNNLVFETSDVNEATQTGWDGKNKDGKEQPSGAYMWVLEGKYADGLPLEYNDKNNGVIRLVR
jgi:hypothetical protein